MAETNEAELWVAKATQMNVELSNVFEVSYPCNGVAANGGEDAFRFKSKGEIGKIDKRYYTSSCNCNTRL